MKTVVVRKSAVALAAFLGAFAVALGLTWWFTGDAGVLSHRAPYGVLGVVGGMFIWTGLWAMRRKPMAGGALLVVGSAAAVAMAWPLFFVPILAMAVIGLGVDRMLEAARHEHRTA